MLSFPVLYWSCNNVFFCCVNTLLFGRRPKLPLSDKRKIVRILRNNQGSNMAQACHEQETGGTPVPLFKVKQVLHCHRLRDCQLRNKPLFQKLTLSSFTENFSYLNEPAKRLLENSLSFSPPKRYVWRTKVEASKLKNNAPCILFLNLVIEYYEGFCCICYPEL